MVKKIVVTEEEVSAVKKLLDNEDQILKKITEQVEGLLYTHKRDIFKGYKFAGDDVFNISISAKLSGSSEVVDCETTISFVLEKIKDMSETTINLRQENLFDKAV